MAGKVLKFGKGFPGNVSRSIDDVIEALANGGATAIAFGAPVVLDGGKVANVVSGKTDIIGIAVRTVKTEKTYGGNDPQYEVGEMVDVLKRGTVTVLVKDEGNTDAAAGGKVYIDKANGDIYTEASGTDRIEMAGWRFKGPVDSDKIAEIVLTERTY